MLWLSQVIYIIYPETFPIYVIYYILSDYINIWNEYTNENVSLIRDDMCTFYQTPSDGGCNILRIDFTYKSYQNYDEMNCEYKHKCDIPNIDYISLDENEPIKPHFGWKVAFWVLISCMIIIILFSCIFGYQSLWCELYYHCLINIYDPITINCWNKTCCIKLQTTDECKSTNMCCCCKCCDICNPFSITKRRNDNITPSINPQSNPDTTTMLSDQDTTLIAGNDFISIGNNTITDADDDDIELYHKQTQSKMKEYNAVDNNDDDIIPVDIVEDE